MEQDIDYAAMEEKLRARVEALLDGRVVTMERQVRWRPSWFADVETAAGMKKVYVRGDRQSDVVPFPELKREADILRVLGEQGIPAPEIYGMCDDPVAIIMEASPGTRDVINARSDEERRSVARQYIEALVKMHRLPLAPFEEIGIEAPEGAEEIALAGVKAYMPLYQKNKVSPEPLIEFSLKWLRDNVPQQRTRASFIAFDAGQFLFSEGQITALYDFEFAMIGDAMTDIATMAMRHSYEPTGDAISSLIAHYEAVSGEPVDTAVVRYHHAVFATVACMQFAGAIKNPKPGDPHDVYMEWDIALRKTLINALSKNLGVALTEPQALTTVENKTSSLNTMLLDSGRQLPADTPLQQAAVSAHQRLLEYNEAMQRCGGELDKWAEQEARAFVGECGSPGELDEKLEAYVQQAGPEDYGPLLQYFSRQLARRMQATANIAIGVSAQHIQDDILD